MCMQITKKRVLNSQWIVSLKVTLVFITQMSN